LKTFITSMIVLAMLLLGISIYSNYLNNTIQSIEKCVEAINKTACQNEWQKCEEEVKELVGVWDTNESVLAMFNDHEDVDNIKLAIGELKESVLHKNYENTFQALTETKILLDRIRKNETFTLENILKVARFDVVSHNML